MAEWTGPPLDLDADDDGDWIKAGRWDLPARTAADLREWLASNRITVESFRGSVLFRSHVGEPDFEWLRDL